MEWSLFGCARKGHVTYAPDEPELRDRLMTPTAGGTAWRCLRCGTFVTHGLHRTEHRTGPAAAAPLPRRGKELRDELILRVFAVERFIRFVVFAVAAYGVWRFKSDRGHIQQAFNHDLPAIRELYADLGFNFDHSKLIGLIQHSFTLTGRTLTYLAIGLVIYSLIELAEGVGLWLGQRWGEYFAMVATSIFLPYEVYDLTVKVTWLRAGALVINLLLVVYLVWSKRLFGVRGGKRAYEARLRTESFIEAEQAALATAQQAQQAEQPTRSAEQPKLPAEPPARSAKPPASSDEESIPLSERRTVPDEQPLLPSEQPTMPVERPVFPIVPEAPRTAMLRVARRPQPQSPVAQETPAGLPGPAPR
ncbi:MAG TPA: DUF2127 domain-containing protein [Streptosporangiaceae bacterium]|nr:DUF2127 domain-containing protein [Streptosporangiaceae bacterium]